MQKTRLLLQCMRELSIAEKALARMTQLAFHKSSRKEFTTEEWSEFADNFMQLGFLEHTVHKLRLQLSEWFSKNSCDKDNP